MTAHYVKKKKNTAIDNPSIKWSKIEQLHGQLGAAFDRRILLRGRSSVYSHSVEAIHLHISNIKLQNLGSASKDGTKATRNTKEVVAPRISRRQQPETTNKKFSKPSKNRKHFSLPFYVLLEDEVLEILI